MFRYPCPGVEAAREGGRCNVGVKGRRTCESDVKGRRSGESDPKGLRTPGKSGVDASCVAVLADCECVGSIIISIHVGERGGESAPDVTSMRNREGERRGFCEGAAMRGERGWEFGREEKRVFVTHVCGHQSFSVAIAIAISRPVTICDPRRQGGWAWDRGKESELHNSTYPRPGVFLVKSSPLT